MKKSLCLQLCLMLVLGAMSAMADVVTVPFGETFEVSLLEAVHSQNENNAVEQLVMEATNTKLNILSVPRANFAEKLNTTLASGQLPDIVSFLWSAVAPLAWVEQGALIPLDEMLYENGNNYMKYVTDELMPFQYDYAGKIYTIKMHNAFTYSSSLMIRHDWLEKLGLEAPETMEEWVEVLRAFKTKDPNGNGMADEIPWMTGLEPFFHAYGITPSSNFVEVEGKLIPRYEHPYFKECVELLASLYAEGLIDQEYAARGNDFETRDELIATSKVGAGSLMGNESTRLTKLIRENGVDNAIFGYIAPIKGPGGQHYPGRAPYGTAAGITIKAKEPDKCLALLDFLFSDEGIVYTNFGKEGVHHELVDGQPRLLEPYVLSWENVRAEGIAKGTWPQYWASENFLQMTFQGKTLEELNEVDQLAYYAYTEPAPYAYFALPASIFSTETNNKLSADIWTPLSDMTNNVIMGNASWEDLDALIIELKDFGMDQITEEVNVNYALVK